MSPPAALFSVVAFRACDVPTAAAAVVVSADTAVLPAPAPSVAELLCCWFEEASRM